MATCPTGQGSRDKKAPDAHREHRERSMGTPGEEQDKLAPAAIKRPVSPQSWRLAARIKAPARLAPGTASLPGLQRAYECSQGLSPG